MTYTLDSTTTFRKWLKELDPVVRRRLLARLDYEMRFFFGAGYRVYYTIRDGRVVLLLAGGDKSSQERDIAKAKAILDSLE